MMSEFIANKIMEAKEAGGTAAGQKKYRTYFITTRIYKRYRENVDLILATEGHEDCIVAE